MPRIAKIPLIYPMHNADHLQHAESAKVISEIPSSVFLRHTARTCGTKSNALQSKPKSENDGDDLFHGVTFSGNLCALRRRALAASSSRVRAGALVSSEASRRAETGATSSTAARNAASLAFEGFANPLIFRTNCRTQPESPPA